MVKKRARIKPLMITSPKGTNIQHRETLGGGGFSKSRRRSVAKPHDNHDSTDDEEDDRRMTVGGNTVEPEDDETHPMSCSGGESGEEDEVILVAEQVQEALSNLDVATGICVGHALNASIDGMSAGQQLIWPPSDGLPKGDKGDKASSLREVSALVNKEAGRARRRQSLRPSLRRASTILNDNQHVKTVVLDALSELQSTASYKEGSRRDAKKERKRKNSIHRLVTAITQTTEKGHVRRASVSEARVLRNLSSSGQLKPGTTNSVPPTPKGDYRDSVVPASYGQTKTPARTPWAASSFPVVGPEDAVETLPFMRQWIFSQEEQPPLGRDAKLKVVTLNVLAECYTNFHPQPYPHCEPKFLKWEYRGAKLMEDILALDPDIICLQEVDHFEDFFHPFLQKYGYVGIFQRRPGRKKDGCATFFKTSKFKLRNVIEIQLNDLANYEQDEDRKWRFMTHNVCLLVQLEHISAPHNISDPYMWIANAHLYWDPQRSDVKVYQTYYILQRMANLRRNKSLIFAGDFNSLPDSAVCELVKTGKVTENHECMKGDETEILLPGMELESSYGKLAFREPPCTNYTPMFQGCIDYIFHKKGGNLEATKVLAVPPKTILQGKSNGMPSQDFPSDHVLLCTEFSWTETRYATETLAKPQIRRPHPLQIPTDNGGMVDHDGYVTVPNVVPRVSSYTRGPDAQGHVAENTKGRSKYVSRGATHAQKYPVLNPHQYGQHVLLNPHLAQGVSPVMYSAGTAGYVSPLMSPRMSAPRRSQQPVAFP